jgi:molecular chaperone GrpE
VRVRRLHPRASDYSTSAVSEEQHTNEANPEEAELDAGSGPDAVADAEAPADPLEAARAEAQRCKDQLLRTAADFDNYRKRTRRDITEAGRAGKEEVLRELLPVFDNLERATAHAETATDVQSLAEGIQMVMRQFVDTLQRIGIERVVTVGCSFDPTVHEAIQHLESGDHAPGTVMAEVQAGYRAAERLVRPALVVVAKARAEAAGGGGGAPPADSEEPGADNGT